jgi:hypothetical protein
VDKRTCRTFVSKYLHTMTRQKTEIRQEQIKQAVIDVISFNIYMFTQYIDKVLTNNCTNNMEKMI